VSAAKLVARLNAKPNQLDAIPGQKGLGITPQDVAGAIGLAKLPYGPDYLLRHKYAKQDFENEIKFSLRMILSSEFKWSKAQKLHPYFEEIVSKICIESIKDFSDSNTCNTCKGTKYRMDGSLKITCLYCGGTGVRSDKRREKFVLIANEFDIPWRSFQRYWWPIVKVNFDILGRWERIGLGAVKLIGNFD
jgi:hypothetical protein